MWPQSLSTMWSQFLKQGNHFPLHAFAQELKLSCPKCPSPMPGPALPVSSLSMGTASWGRGPSPIRVISGSPQGGPGTHCRVHCILTCFFWDPCPILWWGTRTEQSDLCVSGQHKVQLARVCSTNSLQPSFRISAALAVSVANGARGAEAEGGISCR